MSENRIWDCLVCFKPLPLGEDVCTRCGFQHYPGLDDDQEAVRNFQRPRAAKSRSEKFLPRFDLGVTSYYWKDENGTIAPDTTKRLSFGTAADMEKKTVWLNQEFARLPDEDKLDIEVSVKQDGAKDRTVRFQLPALKEPQLQRLGLELTQDLQLKLTLKNDKSSVTSDPTPFLPD